MKTYILQSATVIQGNNFNCILVSENQTKVEVILSMTEFMKLKQTGFISASKVTRLKKEQQA